MGSFMNNYFIFFVSLFLCSCSVDEETALQKQFVHGCIHAGNPADTCHCIYDDISQHYDKEEMFLMFTDVKHFDRLQQAMKNSQRSCLL